MKRSWLIAVLAVALSIALSAALAGCTPEAPPEVSNPPETPKILHIADWQDKYPEIYQSFKLGATVIKDDGSNRTHSHALHAVPCTGKALTVYAVPDIYFNSVSGRCLLCKTEDFITIYEKYGDDALQMPYVDVLPMVEDFWGCYMCHENDPENTLTAALPYWDALYQGSAVKISDEDATCGQCHNVFHAYKAVKDLTMDKLAAIGPYKYGLGADELRRVVEEMNMDPDENGLFVSVDEPTGLVTFKLQHPDVEIFQTSNHKKLGMSCHSCHMPETTTTAGVTYTSHDASGSPLANEAALRSCLECHSDGGLVKKAVATTQEMVDFTHEIQAEVGAMENKVNSDLKILYNLVLKAVQDGVDDSKLAQAREAYTTAGYYAYFCRGNTTEPGLKAPHNVSEMKSLLTKAQQLVDDAIASF